MEDNNNILLKEKNLFDFNEKMLTLFKNEHEEINEILLIPVKYLQKIINYSKNSEKLLTNDDFNFIAKVIDDTRLSNDILLFLEQPLLKIVSDQLTVSNVCSVYQSFYKLKNSISEKCEKIISENTFDALENESFISLDITTIKHILQNFEKFSINELQLFKFLLKWSQKQCSKINNVDTTAENRKKLLDGAYEYIRYGTLELNEIDELIKLDPNFFNSSEIANMFLTYYEYKSKESIMYSKVKRLHIKKTYEVMVADIPCQWQDERNVKSEVINLESENAGRLKGIVIKVSAAISGKITIITENDEQILFEKTYYKEKNSKEITVNTNLEINSNTIYKLTNNFVDLDDLSENYEFNINDDEEYRNKTIECNEKFIVNVKYPENCSVKCFLFEML